MSGGLRILVVEDDAMSRRLAGDILRRRGHEVILATSADEARARLGEQPPDLVVLDIQIPGGGGEVLLREIRGEARLAGLRVVAVTAYAMAGDRERLIAAGFDGYLSKPIDTRSFGPALESIAARGASIEEEG